MCHSLVMNYGLYKKMEIFVSAKCSPNFVIVSNPSLLPCQRAKPATEREMTQFHSDEYVRFLKRVTPSNMTNFIKEQHKCMIHASCINPQVAEKKPHR